MDGQLWCQLIRRLYTMPQREICLYGKLWSVNVVYTCEAVKEMVCTVLQELFPYWLLINSLPLVIIQVKWSMHDDLCSYLFIWPVVYAARAAMLRRPYAFKLALQFNRIEVSQGLCVHGRKVWRLSLQAAEAQSVGLRMLSPPPPPPPAPRKCDGISADGMPETQMGISC